MLNSTIKRLYVVDCARLFPCEPPDRHFKNGHLYRMLRPELVRENPVPLSSDAYLPLAKHDKKVGCVSFCCASSANRK